MTSCLCESFSTLPFRFHPHTFSFKIPQWRQACYLQCVANTLRVRAPLAKQFSLDLFRFIWLRQPVTTIFYTLFVINYAVSLNFFGAIQKKIKFNFIRNLCLIRSQFKASV